ncbi:MAG: hypothetical protein KGI80_00165 [Verrucomicrobiota bacterium]|nr:hypothetical protein [Verrucomicrobiota bacterium]
MRRLLWLLFLLGLYVWISVTGNEAMLIERGKLVYRFVVHWLEDADIDFHLDNHSQRWVYRKSSKV